MTLQPSEFWAEQMHPPVWIQESRVCRRAAHPGGMSVLYWAETHVLAKCY